jgi:hypothetical protein
MGIQHPQRRPRSALYPRESIERQLLRLRAHVQLPAASQLYGTGARHTAQTTSAHVKLAGPHPLAARLRGHLQIANVDLPRHRLP